MLYLGGLNLKEEHRRWSTHCRLISLRRFIWSEGYCPRAGPSALYHRAIVSKSCRFLLVGSSVCRLVVRLVGNLQFNHRLVSVEPSLTAIQRNLTPSITGSFGPGIGCGEDRGLVGGQRMPARSGCVRSQGFRGRRPHSSDVPHVGHDHAEISPVEEVGHDHREDL